MEKQKRWQLYLILAVIILTLYNILPTIFYYSKPLKDPITAPRAERVANEIVERVNALEDESKAWLTSFSKLLGVKAVSIELKADDPRVIEVSFSNKKEAALFKRFLPQAGRLIAFVPAQLELYPDLPGTDSSKVYVSRQIGLHLKTEEISKLFHFSSKVENGQVSPLYQEIAFDRATQIILGLAGSSKPAQQMASIVHNENTSSVNDLTIHLAKEIVDMEKTLGKSSPILKRYYASFTQTDVAEKETLLQNYVSRVASLKGELQKQRGVVTDAFSSRSTIARASAPGKGGT